MVAIHGSRDLSGRTASSAGLGAAHMDGIPGVGGAAWWYGAATYLLYQYSETVGFNLRNELFEDDKGVRTGTPGLYYDICANIAWSP